MSHTCTLSYIGSFARGGIQSYADTKSLIFCFCFSIEVFLGNIKTQEES